MLANFDHSLEHEVKVMHYERSELYLHDLPEVNSLPLSDKKKAATILSGFVTEFQFSNWFIKATICSSVNIGHCNFSQFICIHAALNLESRT